MNEIMFPYGFLYVLWPVESQTTFDDVVYSLSYDGTRDVSWRFNVDPYLALQQQERRMRKDFELPIAAYTAQSGWHLLILGNYMSDVLDYGLDDETPEPVLVAECRVQPTSYFLHVAIPRVGRVRYSIVGGEFELPDSTVEIEGIGNPSEPPQRAWFGLLKRAPKPVALPRLIRFREDIFRQRGWLPESVVFERTLSATLQNFGVPVPTLLRPEQFQLLELF